MKRVMAGAAGLVLALLLSGTAAGSETLPVCVQKSRPSRVRNIKAPGVVLVPCVSKAVLPELGPAPRPVKKGR